jgi:hypothetical protein
MTPSDKAMLIAGALMPLLDGSEDIGWEIQSGEVSFYSPPPRDGGRAGWAATCTEDALMACEPDTAARSMAAAIKALP